MDIRSAAINVDLEKLGKVVDIALPGYGIQFKARIRPAENPEYLMKVGELARQDPQRWEDDAEWRAEVSNRAEGGTVLMEIPEGLEVDGEPIGENVEWLERIMSDPGYKHIAFRIRLEANACGEMLRKGDEAEAGNS